MKPLILSISFLLSLFFCCCTNNDIEKKPIIDFSTSKGVYTHSSFKSEARGMVDFNVYLPPNWSKVKHDKYPLIFLLHGQGESENKFIVPFSADSMNTWINRQLIPEMVIVSLRGGKDTNKMQWYSDANERMITNNDEGELRRFCRNNFNTSMQSNQISLMGHSRGATGALNFALYFPNDFASVVSGAFVSDYAIERLKQATNQNLNAIINSRIGVKMIIGDKDQFVLNNDRKGSPVMSAFLKEKGIIHDFKIYEGRSHRLFELWDYPVNLECLQYCSSTWDYHVN